jgi:hypothetical protein
VIAICERFLWEPPEQRAFANVISPMTAQAEIRVEQRQPGSGMDRPARGAWLRIVTVLRFTRKPPAPQPARDPVLSVQTCL